MPRQDLTKKPRYGGVPEGIGEHYWHGNKVKGYWSVIKPFGQTVVNGATNPSAETDTSKWVGLSGVVPGPTGGANYSRSDLAAIHGNFGIRVVTEFTNQGVAYDMWTQFSFNTPYSACVSVDGPAGAVVTFKFEYPTGSPTTFSTPTIVILPGYPIRICVSQTPIPTDAGPLLPILPIALRFDQAGTYYVDGLVLTSTADPVTSYFDGDSPDATWLGVPHASSSSTTGFSRTFGEEINFNEIGFNITGGTGFGLTPRQLITTSFARLNGAHLQRTKDLPRVITLTGIFEGPSPEDMHEARQTLIDALIWRFKNQCTQELILTYALRDECGCRVSEELQIPVEYQAGLEGLWGTLDRERATLTFVANSQQSFNAAFDSSAALDVNGTSIITYEGTDDAWLEIQMWPGAGGMNVSAIHNDTTGHSVYFGTSAVGGNPTALPLAYGPPTREYAVLRTDPAKRISLDLYQYDVSSGTPSGAATQTRIMHYIRYSISQVGLLRLVPGENQIRAQASLFSAGSRILLRWRNRYLSVDHLCAGVCVEA